MKFEQECGRNPKKVLYEHMLQLFSDLGPFEQTEIARRLGVSNSSVSRFHRRLLERRIKLKPNVNAWSLGLRRPVARVSFLPDFETHARDICFVLAESAYVGSFARLIPEREWELQFQVPSEHQGELFQLLAKLEEFGILKLIDLYQTDLRIGAPFRWKYFNTEEMKFEFDWYDIKKPRSLPDPEELRTERVPFDKTDLLILEQLQIEPLSMAELSRKSGLDKWRIYWHWKNHVQGKLFKDWSVNWLGTWPIDQDERKVKSRREFTVFNLLAKSLLPDEMRFMRERIYSLPYFWSENLGKTDLVAQLFIPNQALLDAFSYFGYLQTGVNSKIVIRVEDQQNAITMTLPASSYDDEKGWMFDLDEVVADLRRKCTALKVGG